MLTPCLSSTAIGTSGCNPRASNVVFVGPPPPPSDSPAAYDAESVVVVPFLPPPAPPSAYVAKRAPELAAAAVHSCCLCPARPTRARVSRQPIRQPSQQVQESEPAASPPTAVMRSFCATVRCTMGRLRGVTKRSHLGGDARQRCTVACGGLLIVAITASARLYAA